MTALYRPDLMGTVTLSPTGRFAAGSVASFTLTYSCGKFGIDDLGGIIVAFRSANDQTALQTTDPKALGYVTAEATSGAKLDVRYDPRGYIRPWYKALTIRAKEFLKAGDQIVVRIGDQRWGGPGLRLQTFCERDFEFRVLADPIATGRYTLLPSSPVIQIVPGTATRWRLIAPTQRRVGEAFSVGIRAEDKWGNAAVPTPWRLTLKADRPVAGLPQTIEWPSHESAQRIEGLLVDREADLRLSLTDGSGAVLAVSNPLRVTDRFDWNHYWSDLHGQSEETIGTNSAASYFAFGRDQAFLDLCAHQGNDFQITRDFWTTLNELTADNNRPGHYVTLPGFEWSGNTGVGGDHNVWYRDEGRPIFRSSHALVDDLGDENTDCHTAQDLFGALRDENAIVTAHCGGRYADVKYAHDGRLEPSVEIHSCWGTFEWILRDALEAGYRVGVVAASDDHKGRPGASHPGASKFGAYGGFTCHLMPELNRDALFDSFRRRHHYATTGTRLWLGVSAEFAHGRLYDTNPAHGRAASCATQRATMGDIVALADEEFTFNVEIHADAPIERVEVRDGLDLVEVVRPYNDADLGSRIRVVWEGAETRGRGRNVVWDGTADCIGNRIRRFRGINFWNAERPLREVAENRLAWSSFTTGSFSGFDIWLAERDAGTLRIKTPFVSFELPIGEIGLEDTVFEAGGLEKRVRVFRQPDENRHRHLSLKRSFPVRAAGDTRPYVCVTQEDGHRAWSSPLYVFKQESEAR